MIQRLYHVNVNVIDLDKSIAFYEKFGFKLGSTSAQNAPGLGRAFKTRSGSVRWAHMQIGEGPEVARLDLVQWHDGPKQPPPRKPLDEPGLARFSLLSDDIHKEYERLKNMGVEFLTPPDVCPTKYGDFLLCVAVDPDNSNVQLIQPPKGV